MRRLRRERLKHAAGGRSATRQLSVASRIPAMASLLFPMALLMARPAMAADEQVGVNSAVNPAGTGTPPNGPTRQLMIGQDVVFKERVDTTSVGQTQIMFLDESSM